MTELKYNIYENSKEYVLLINVAGYTIDELIVRSEIKEETRCYIIETKPDIRTDTMLNMLNEYLFEQIRTDFKKEKFKLSIPLSKDIGEEVSVCLGNGLLKIIIYKEKDIN